VSCVLTGELRQQLREAIDVAVRARVDWQAAPRCVACGIELADDEGKPQYLIGCRTCSDRRCKHRRVKSQSPQLVHAGVIA
jgi:hypothetical protein